MRRAVQALAILAAVAISGCGTDPSDRALTEIEKRADAKKREIEQGEKDLKKKVERERRRLQKEAEELESATTATEAAPAPTTTAPEATGGAQAP